ncbi:MAG: UPF0182 family protein [Armatimonadetes bacterium]|nr:UPF0182 family protein [Armatimonadota bacterium]
MKRNNLTTPAVLVALALLLVGGIAVGIYTEYLWFQEMRYTGVFWTTLKAKAAMGAVGAAAVFLLFWANVRIARRTRRHRPALRVIGDNLLEVPDRDQIEPVVNRLLPLALAGAALLAGFVFSSLWEEALRFRNPVAFGKSDPLFAKDIAFYVFQFPLLKAVYGAVLAALGLSALVAAALYVWEGKVVASQNEIAVDPMVKPHLFSLLALMLLVKAVGYRLNMYELLYSPRGVAYGASYTDVHVVLPVLKVLLVLAALSAVFLFVSAFRPGWKAAAAVAGLWLVVALVGGQALPSAVQKLQVAPNELKMEQPYIEHNIHNTRAAYNLANVDEQEFAADESLTAADLQANNLTVENIRLWDHRLLLTAYKQLQEIRTYYDFPDADIDRYTLGDKYRQVIISAREISSDRLPSKLWINERLTYTHGYGAVVSPVNRISNEGLPDFMVKNIPPTGEPELRITRPEVYYGEISSEYVFVKTKAREFDYPAGEQNVYTNYDGGGGVPVGGFFRRLLFARRFNSLPILLNQDITPESRVMYYRRVHERLQRIAPFLLFDRDAYIVISGGRLYWMCDAYTRTDMYPYSQPIPGLGNYFRNPVKAVVDAYHGTASFYIADPTDPIIQTYHRIFPGLFQPLEKMDPDLQKHIRYPQTLFDVQARMLAVYHMTDPQVFYNKEDVWEIPAGEATRTATPAFAAETGPAAPRSPFGPRAAPAPVAPRARAMEPYYTIMKLPGAEKEEFIQLIPFTPAKKDNLRAWMCARNDPPNYGELIVYSFPKAKLVYGPSQVNARIEQEAQISQQLTLWRQGGSDVIRGNLLSIPIEQSLLYVQPLYLKAASGEIPELKRVIAAYGDRIAMETNLERALNTLFGEGRPAAAAAAPRPAGSAPAAAAPTSEQAELARRALQHLRQARESYRGDDWARFGKEMKELEETLRRMNEGER